MILLLRKVVEILKELLGALSHNTRARGRPRQDRVEEPVAAMSPSPQIASWLFAGTIESFSEVLRVGHCALGIVSKINSPSNRLDLPRYGRTWAREGQCRSCEHPSLSCSFHTTSSHS